MGAAVPTRYHVHTKYCSIRRLCVCYQAVYGSIPIPACSSGAQEASVACTLKAESTWIDYDANENAAQGCANITRNLIFCPAREWDTLSHETQRYCRAERLGCSGAIQD